MGMPNTTLFFYIPIVIAIFLFFASEAHSFNAESTNFKLETGNFNYTSGEKSSESYWLHDTGGELAPGEFGSTNYTVKAGFEYITALIPFTFEISNNFVDFGLLSPDVPATDTTDLTVTTGAVFGYKVTAQENHPLMHNTNPSIFIPNVEGDNSDITHTQEGDWLQNTTHGFGYTLANLISADAAFTTGYRAFADESATQSPVEIMGSNSVTEESSVEVTYKVNISSTQAAGTYQNVITYIATSTY